MAGLTCDEGARLGIVSDTTRERNRLRVVVGALCQCRSKGNPGPGDEELCPACEVWIAMDALHQQDVRARA